MGDNSIKLATDMTFFIGSLRVSTAYANLCPLSFADKIEFLADCISYSKTNSYGGLVMKKFNDEKFYEMIEYCVTKSKEMYITTFGSRYSRVAGFYFVMNDIDGLYFKMLTSINNTIHDGKDHWEYI